MQRQSFAWEIKNIDDAGNITGLAAAYGNVDHGGDRIVRGAFSKAISAIKSVPMLLFHDQTRPIGSWTEFRETDDGLEVSGKISTKTRDGSEAYQLARDGALPGLSIGYDVVAKNIVGDVRELLELALYEVSLVTIGMNPNARVSSVKAQEDLRNRLAAGDRLTEREWERLLKDSMGLSNSEAERVVRVHDLTHGRGEPDNPEADPMSALFAAMADAEVVDLTGE